AAADLPGENALPARAADIGVEQHAGASPERVNLGEARQRADDVLDAALLLFAEAAGPARRPDGEMHLSIGEDDRRRDESLDVGQAEIAKDLQAKTRVRLIGIETHHLVGRANAGLDGALERDALGTLVRKFENRRPEPLPPDEAAAEKLGMQRLD